MVDSINKPNSTELLVFYFAEGDYARMGTHHAYALGIDKDNQIWNSSGPCYGYINDPDSFTQSNTPFKKSHLDMTSQIITILLEKKKPEEWEKHQECYAGMGNIGVCLGKMIVPLVYHHD